MASLIWLGNLYGLQEPVKARSLEDEMNNGTRWNLDEDIRGNHIRTFFIAKGNIIAGVEAKT